MPTIPDSELLRRYAVDRSEDAFAELVSRHVDLVYSAALRQVSGDGHHAEDITQAVFTELAKRAGRLVQHPSLPGWLYTTTRLMAARVRRTENRRLVREQEAHVMNAIESNPSSEANWDELRPLLDDVMHELDDKDRTVVLLRYFKNQSLKEVGDAIGLGDNAARMRVDRALEKLRAALARRGVKTTGALLAGALCTNAVLSAPAGLAGTVTTASLAAVGAATASSIGIIAFLTSAKTASIAAALCLVLTGTVAINVYKSRSDKKESASPPPLTSLRPDGARGTNRFFALPGTGVRTALNARPDDDLATALARVKEVLNDPNSVRMYPNQAMKDALDGLGDHRKAAVPMLREALKNGKGQIKRVAVDALGQMGHEAIDAVPDLVERLRVTKLGDSSAITSALEKIGPLPEILRDLVQIVKENPDTQTRTWTAAMIARTFKDEGKRVDEMLRPLLQDSDPAVRLSSASALAMMQKSDAGTDVIRIAIESLKSDDLLLVYEAVTALQNAGRDPKNRGRATAAAEEAIPALIDLANNSKRGNLREMALQALDRLAPDLRKDNPDMDAFLREEQQMSAFLGKVALGQASVSEIVEGIKRFPKASPTAAEALVSIGDNAQSALPALRDALAALDPKPGNASPDAIHARQRVANAIQKIAPDEPKPVFTLDDMRSISGILDSISSQADFDRRQRILAAKESVVSGTRTKGFELTPDQMRSLLAALKETDKPAFDAVVVEVNKIDPKFSPFDSVK